MQNLEQTNKNLPIKIALFSVATIFLMWLINPQPPSSSDLFKKETFQRLSCKTDATNKEVFTVWTTAPVQAEPLLDLLCGDGVMKERFAEIVIQWGNDREIKSGLDEGIYDLAYSPVEISQLPEIRSIWGYQAIVKYPDYFGYFIGLDHKPELTRSWMLGKSIGLQSSEQSRSGWIVPMEWFGKIKIRNDKEIKVVRFQTHREARKTLIAGKVDLIASYWSENEQESFPKTVVTQIPNGFISGAEWILKGQWIDSRYCQLIAKLVIGSTQESRKKYFKRALSTSQCSNHI